MATIAAMRASASVFSHIDLDLGVIGIGDYRSLAHLYDVDRLRSETYELMAATVIEEAQRTGPVSFLTYGHPVVGSTVTSLLIDMAGRLNIRWEILDAPSSIEAVCRVLEIDPFNGLQIWRAQDLLDSNSRCQPDTWTLIAQAPYIGAQIGNHSVDADRFDREVLSELRDKLCTIYGARHQVHYVRVETASAHRSVRSGLLCDLVSFTPRSSATLAIPPLAIHQ